MMSCYATVIQQCPFNSSPCLGTGLWWEKIQMISYIHNILLIPQPPNASPHPPNPTCWGEGGEGEGGAHGVGGVGWGIGGVGYEKNIVFISMHTHMLVPRLRWEKIGNPQIPVPIQAFSTISPAKWIRNRRAVNWTGPGSIYLNFLPEISPNKGGTIEGGSYLFCKEFNYLCLAGFPIASRT